MMSFVVFPYNLYNKPITEEELNLLAFMGSLKADEMLLP